MQERMEPGPTRLKQAWTRRKGTILWSLVAVLAIVLTVVIGVRVFAGATDPPRHFSFTMGASACNCTRVTQRVYAFPTSASVNFHWWVTWTGNNATAQLAVQKSDGSPVFEAISEYQQGNPLNPNVTWAQGGAGSFSGKGSPFTFIVDLVATPDFLPADTTVWVNGTYTTPLL
jgi:hypothetical protein